MLSSSAPADTAVAAPPALSRAPSTHTCSAAGDGAAAPPRPGSRASESAPAAGQSGGTAQSRPDEPASCKQADGDGAELQAPFPAPTAAEGGCVAWLVQSCMGTTGVTGSPKRVADEPLAANEPKRQCPMDSSATAAHLTQPPGASGMDPSAAPGEVWMISVTDPWCAWHCVDRAEGRARVTRCSHLRHHATRTKVQCLQVHATLCGGRCILSL